MSETKDTEANFDDTPAAVSRRLRHILIEKVESHQTTNNDRHRFARLLVDLLAAHQPAKRVGKKAKAKQKTEADRVALFGGKAK